MNEASGATGAFNQEVNLHPCLDPIDPRADWAQWKSIICACAIIVIIDISLTFNVLKNAKSQRTIILTS
jgi:hypothetical protein